MPKVTIRLFASLRESAGGRDRLELELPEPAGTIGGLLAQLEQRFPVLASRTGQLLAARNLRYASLDEPLADGDEIAFFPPVSGG